MARMRGEWISIQNARNMAFLNFGMCRKMGRRVLFPSLSPTEPPSLSPNKAISVSQQGHLCFLLCFTRNYFLSHFSQFQTLFIYLFTYLYIYLLFIYDFIIYLFRALFPYIGPHSYPLKGGVMQLKRRTLQVGCHTSWPKHRNTDGPQSNILMVQNTDRHAKRSIGSH